MNDNFRLFIKNFVPFIKNFKSCSILWQELNLIDQRIADQLNEKNRYTALDKPDVKIYMHRIRNYEIVKLFLQKMKIFDEYECYVKEANLYLDTNNKKYLVIVFEYGNLPVIPNNLDEGILFLVNKQNHRVYYCGILDSNKIDFKNTDMVGSVSGVKKQYLLNQIEDVLTFAYD